MTVTICLATFNGAATLRAQLESLAAQSLTDWRLWISDDGSTDATLAVIAAFRADFPRCEVRLLRGPARGAAANFLHLLCHPDLPPGPVAFCDQDDVWLTGKLARALARLRHVTPGRPGLYAAESFVTDSALRVLRRSGTGWAGVRRAGSLRAGSLRTGSGAAQPGFGNALVQNLCSGHTMVLNAEAVALARRAGRPAGIAFHDWWLYQLVSGAGGQIVLDPLAVALYRQHRGNVIGATGPLAALLRRAGLVLRRDYARWLRAHHAALRAAGALLAPEARTILAALEQSECHPGTARLRLFRRLGLRRSALPGTLALWCAAALGRA